MDKFPPVVGEVILRPISLIPKPGKGSLCYAKEPAELEFPLSTNGEKMFWARRQHDVDNLWVARIGEKGMTCFIDGVVPDDFTHFTIKSVGRSGKSVRVEPGSWESKQDLLDLYTTPNEERNAHNQLVQRVVEVLKSKPDLLPVKTLVKRMPQAQFFSLCKEWLDKHKTQVPQDARKVAMEIIREVVEKLGT